MLFSRNGQPNNEQRVLFHLNMFPEVDPTLGPEMKSTGEVLGIADSFGLARGSVISEKKSLIEYMAASAQ
jgi:hypothetical protein